MDDLEKVYRETSYIVDDGGVKLTIRMGGPNLELAELMRERNADTWAFLTAHNPRSQPLTDPENVARQADLLTVLDRQGYSYLQGRGVGDDPAWEPEPSIFILEISREHAITLGRQFDQNAILWGQKGSEPELIWCR